MLKSLYILCTDFLVLEISFRVYFVSEEHLLRVLRAYDCGGEGLCGEAIYVIGMGMGEEVKQGGPLEVV